VLYQENLLHLKSLPVENFGVYKSKKQFTIGILADGFVNWGGGIDFLRLILRSLQTGHTPDNLKIFLICAESRHQTPSRLWKAARFVYRFVCRKDQVKKRVDELLVSNDFIQSNFGDLLPDDRFILYSGSDSDLNCISKKLGCDVLLPAIRPLTKKVTIPWVGYIYDFQHKYLPELFSFKQRILRNVQFFKMLFQAPVVIVNAKAVAEDCRKFFPFARAAVCPLPFTPVTFQPLTVIEAKTALQTKYMIPGDYFIICNQMWAHKDHITAIRAFAASNAHALGVSLVLTGAFDSDPRSPELYGNIQKLITALNLSGSVKILGRIPKVDQLCLMHWSIAVVQPTLFEGGPGGGQVYEAVALGVPVLLSDIPVNREVDCSSVEFFEPGNADQLGILLAKHAASPKLDRLNRDNRLKRELELLSKLGKTILDLIPNDLGPSNRDHSPESEGELKNCDYDWS
jgi:glycosyltransferase involved in cell wall biosynthesis